MHRDVSSLYFESVGCKYIVLAEGWISLCTVLFFISCCKGMY